jgi:hypothetical protein
MAMISYLFRFIWIILFSVALLICLCQVFKKIMENEFQMSMMGELNLFLGIQVKQRKQGTFVHQAKYMKDLMKKFNMGELKPVSTLMSTTTVLDPDENGKAVDQKEYRSMIGSLLYLRRHDRTFSLLRSSHRQTIQQIFRYLKYTLEFRIWYSATSSLDLVRFSNAEFTGYEIDRKSTSGTCHFLRFFLVCWSSHKQTSVAQSTIEAKYVAIASKFFR